MSDSSGQPLPPTPATPGYSLSALPLRARLARALRRALRIDRERRWNREFAEGKWQWLHNLDELAHHGVLAAYISYCKPNSRVLDVGCGSGTLHQQLRGCYATYVGIDYAEPVKLAAQHGDARSTFIAADMNEFTPEGQFDVIVFNESIYYLVDLLDGLKRYEGMMAPDALFVVSMHGQPRNLALWAQIDSTYQVLDAVTITNQRGVQWTCKVFRR
jgi:SAM-dependent methyltransferase